MADSMPGSVVVTSFHLTKEPPSTKAAAPSYRFCIHGARLRAESSSTGRSATSSTPRHPPPSLAARTSLASYSSWPSAAPVASPLPPSAGSGAAVSSPAQERDSEGGRERAREEEREEEEGEGEAVVVEGVYLGLGRCNVLNNCSLSIPRGQLWMLLGPNGCGKSSLLKVLAGLMVLDKGRLWVRQPRSFVFQNPDHQVVMPTVESDVAFGLGSKHLTPEEVEERVHSSLSAVGMRDYAGRSVSTLSGGQKQRVAIAGALAQSARVLLLDELTTFLDEADQMGVVRAVKSVVGGPAGVSALWVTHRLEELQYADGAFYMDQGSVVVKGSPRRVGSHIRRLQHKAMWG